MGFTKKYFKTGVVLSMAYPDCAAGDEKTLGAIKKIAADSYFTAIEVPPMPSPEIRKAAAGLLAAAHMSVTYGGSARLLGTGQNINDLDEAKRKTAVDNMKAGIDEAYDLGCYALAFLSRGYEEATKNQSVEALVKSTVEMCEYAALRGDLKIILEVFDYDIDKKSVIGPTPLALKYAEAVSAKCKNFGLLVDLSHIPLLHETIDQSVMPVKDYIIHAHIGNCVMKSADMPGYGDLHPRFGFPNGENDVPEVIEFLRALKSIGFFNEKNPPVLSFEVKPIAGEDPDVVVANAKRVLDEAWANI